MSETATVPAQGFACPEGHLSTTEGAVCALCEPVPKFFDELEQAWWRLMQGELLPDRDPALAALALSMLDAAKENVEATKDAIEQYDGKGEVIVGDLTTEEYARRVAAGLAVLFYGGQ